jgi:hypothetical protein
MVTYTLVSCPQCNAPLPTLAPTGVMHCAYCGVALVPSTGGVRLMQAQEADLPEPGRTRLWAGGRRYILDGRVAKGSSSDVFLGRFDHRLSERVVVKMLRAPEDLDVFRHEWEVLGALQRATRDGTAHFSRLMPSPVAFGEARLGIHGTEGTRQVMVLGLASGFVHTFHDVAAAYPAGIPPGASIWLWKRVLESLAWLHGTGWVHCAVLPAHLLVHARDHGVRLVGFSCATHVGAPVQVSAGGLTPGVQALPAIDFAMSARAVQSLLGAAPPEPLQRLLERASNDAVSFADGWALIAEVDRVAREVFGPPQYVPFHMPGWN